MPKSKKPKQSLRSRLTSSPLLIVGILVNILAIGSGLVFAQLNDDSSADTPEAADSAIQDDDSVNLDPPTEEEKQAAEEHKQNLSEDKPGAPSDAPDGGQQVTPIITSASRTEVNAYISGVFEDGGTCTATATKGSQVITKSSKGFENVSYTSCAPISWSLPSGTWSVVVAYSSSSAKGQSDSWEIP